MYLTSDYRKRCALSPFSYCKWPKKTNEAGDTIKLHNNIINRENTFTRELTRRFQIIINYCHRSFSFSFSSRFELCYSSIYLFVVVVSLFCFVFFFHSKNWQRSGTTYRHAELIRQCQVLILRLVNTLQFQTWQKRSTKKNVPSNVRLAKWSKRSEHNNFYA